MVQIEEKLHFLTFPEARPGWGRQPRGGRGFKITDIANCDMVGVGEGGGRERSGGGGDGVGWCGGGGGGGGGGGVEAPSLLKT